MSVGRDQTALDEHFVGYSLPPALGAVIQNASEAAARCALRVELLTQDGKAVAAVTVRADQLTNAGTNNFPGTGLLLGDPFGPPRYLLSPTMYFRTHPGGSGCPGRIARNRSPPPATSSKAASRSSSRRRTSRT